MHFGKKHQMELIILFLLALMASFHHQYYSCHLREDVLLFQQLKGRRILNVIRSCSHEFVEHFIFGSLRHNLVSNVILSQFVVLTTLDKR